MGLPGAGKTTVFNALARAHAEVGGYTGASSQPNLAVVKVPDERLERLRDLFQPRKFTPAEVRYVDVAGIARGVGKDGGGALLAHLRNTDVLLLVIRAFGSVASQGSDPTPLADVEEVLTELMLADLDVVEKRLDRLRKEARLAKGTPAEQLARETELGLLERINATLVAERPVREAGLSPADEKFLRGYGFLTGKPMLVVVNSDEPDDRAEAVRRQVAGRVGEAVSTIVLAGRLEMELGELSGDEATELMEAYGITESGLTRVIQLSYRQAQLISFFTVGPDECRAWTLRSGSNAVDAAGAIHSDLARGFIRAEVIRWDQLLEAGSFAEARKRAMLRSEGKVYTVADGDVIEILFNV